MLGYVLFISMVTLLFDGSVATTQRSFSPFVNPAGIAISPGFEASYLGCIHGDDTSHTIGLSLGSIGLGTMVKGNKSDFILTSGFPIKDWLYLGLGYRFGNTKGYSIGTTVRPHKFLSVGFVGDKVDDRYLFSPGVGIRPGTDRVTLTFDIENYNKGDDSLNYTIGMSIEPVSGLFIKANTNGVEWKAGISISFGKFGFGSRYGKTDNYDAGIVFSKERYTTFMKPEPSFAELRIKGSYPELERSGFIFERIDAPFYKLLNRIEKLSKDDACKGLFLEIKAPSMHMSQWEEIRDALFDFKSRDKKIYIYSTYYGLGSLYLSSVADSLFLHPAGEIWIPGVQAKRIYFKGTIEKLGIEAQIERIGKFKSAAEPFERKEMSEEDSLQFAKYLGDVYYPVIETIAKARGISTDSLQKLVDEGIFFNGEEAVQTGLVDAIWEKDKVDSIICKKGDKFKKEKVVRREWKTDKKKIALVVAEGNIIQGKSSQGYIGSDDMVEMLEGIKNDKKIKAVVFRVNSGGGDALASELIANALKDVGEKKPIIVSMGSVAGSGGYFISTYGDKIYADNSTITGSIGVIWASFLLKGLYDKIGISWDIIKLGEHADILSDIHKWDDYEREKIKKSVEWWYSRFTEAVASGRDTTKEYIHSIGEGRIWSGVSAKEIGLIDDVGGMLEALKEAQKMAKIKERKVVIYPKPKRELKFGPSFGINTYLSSLKSLLSSEYLYIMPYRIEVDER
ncbi:MAG: signal peptide peptidase SppA [candidate division WOR-3 bacterium]|nr:signal peptide peptidase SppA [candidate division WOR-3 bacterium]